MIIGIDASRANKEKKTGVESYAWHLIQELKTLIPDNHRVLLYTDKPLTGELADLPKNWEEKLLGWPPKRLWTQIRLSWEMFRRAPDVLFIPAHVFPLIHPKKTVMTLHDVAPARFQDSYSRFQRWYGMWSSKYAVKKLWKLITPSEFTKHEIMDVFQTKAENISVVPLAYDHKRFTQVSEDDVHKIRAIYGITKPYFLSIGRIEEKKNTRCIVEAFDLFRNHHPAHRMQLVLAGKPGFGHEAVEKQIKQSKFKRDILRIDWVPDDAVPALLQGAATFVFPSKYEGFGIPVLEAFALGVPVVISTGNSLEEVGGDIAFHTHADNIEEIEHAMRASLNHDADRIEKGRTHAQSYTWKACAEKTLKVLLG